MHGYLVACALLVLPVGAAGAQSLSVAAGLAVPQGEMAERRATGGQLSLLLAPPHRRAGFTVRAEIAAGRFPTRAGYARALVRAGAPAEGDVSVRSALLYALYSTAPGRASFHVGVGAGAHGLRIPGRPNPYGLVPGIGFVAGTRIGRGRVCGLVELQQQVILSDFGNGDFQPSTFAPLRVGVSVQPGP